MQIINTIPIDEAYLTTLSFNGLLTIACITKNNKCPPSNNGIGKRFINPKLIEIKAIIHINSCIPLSAALDARIYMDYGLDFY